MTVPAVSRTLDLIEAFSQVRRPMTVSALAKLLNLPTSSCHGIVKTLEERGYLVDLKKQGGYYFTKRFQMHAQRIAAYDPLPDWLHPAMGVLRDTAGETVLLAKLADQRAVYLEVFESGQSVRYIAQVGDTRPLHASAAGKALLGGLPPDQRNAMIQEMDLARHNEKTLGSADELRANIEQGIARGWFLTEGEYLSEVTALAVPLMVGNELYAVVIAGPGIRLGNRLNTLSELLLDFKASAQRDRG
jgi:DNA-binding IclR family transcriptional regulator